MKFPPHFAPPTVAVWLINLFASTEEAESILGDLLEEFSVLAFESGLPLARNWFWRQTIKTVPRLAGFSFRTAPWITGFGVVGGFLLRKLIAPLVGSATFAVLDRYKVFFEHHFSAYLFLVSTGLDIEYLATFLLIGFIVAFVARRAEMVATIILALIWGAMAVVGSAYGAISTGNAESLWRLTWYFADSFAIVGAGIIVRMYRLAGKFRSSSN
jgi:hypothetical protein